MSLSSLPRFLVLALLLAVTCAGIQKENRVITALMDKNTEAALLAIEEGARVNHMWNQDYSNQERYVAHLLGLAIYEGNDEVVRVLIDKGADVNKREQKVRKNGHFLKISCLALALTQNNTDLARFLLEKGATAEKHETKTHRKALKKLGYVHQKEGASILAAVGKAADAAKKSLNTADTAAAASADAGASASESASESESAGAGASAGDTEEEGLASTTAADVDAKKEL